MALRPGQIYYAEANGGRRPVLIVSREELNQGRYVLAVPFTSADFEKRSKQSNCVPFHQGQFGLVKNCVARGDAITFLEIAAIDEELLGEIDEATLRDVIRAIGYAIASECEPE